MSFDRAILAERASAVERHLARVADRLPPDASELIPATDRLDRLSRSSVNVSSLP